MKYAIGDTVHIREDLVAHRWYAMENHHDVNFVTCTMAELAGHYATIIAYRGNQYVLDIIDYVLWTDGMFADKDELVPEIENLNEQLNLLL